MEFCTNCQKQVITFKQEYTTMPQTDNNEVRRYRETFCALCGNCLDQESIDEFAGEEK